MKNKTKSIIFAVCFWIFIKVFLFVICPLSALSKEVESFISDIFLMVLGLFFILFWALRCWLEKGNNWHWCGTLVFHGMNIPEFVYFITTVARSAPLYLPYQYLNNTDVDWATATAIFFSIVFMVIMLVADLLITGFRFVVRSLSSVHKTNI